MSSHASTPQDPEDTRTVLGRPAELLGLVGQRLGRSPWVTITQPDVDDFARVTRDEQWIHVDPERAAAGPFGATIVHGFYLLGLCAHVIEETVRIEEMGMSVNYGLDRVRFLSPVPVGTRVRGTADLASADAFDGGVKYTLTLTIEAEGIEKPVCVAAVVALAYDR